MGSGVVLVVRSFVWTLVCSLSGTQLGVGSGVVLVVRSLVWALV